MLKIIHPVAGALALLTIGTFWLSTALSELFASQVHHAIARELYKDENPDAVIYLGNKDVGEFMKKKVFEPGRTLSWNALTEHATGEPLKARAFAADFKGK